VDHAQGAVHYDVGNPDEQTVLDVAELICQPLNDALTITHLDLPVDYPRLRCPDTNHLLNETTWKPTTDFATGLAETIAYFVQELKLI